MDSEYIVGVASITVGFAVSFAVYGGLRDRTYKVRRDTALLTMVAALEVGWMVPQLLKNEELKHEFDRVFQPFFPGIGPLLVLLRIPVSHDLLNTYLRHEACTIYKAIVFSHMFLLLGYLVWIAQYAVYSNDRPTKIVFWALFAVYLVAALWGVRWIFCYDGRPTMSKASVVPNDDDGGNVYTFLPNMDTADAADDTDEPATPGSGLQDHM